MLLAARRLLDIGGPMSIMDTYFVEKKDVNWVVRRERDGNRVTFRDRDDAVEFARQRARLARPCQV